MLSVVQHSRAGITRRILSLAGMLVVASVVGCGGGVSQEQQQVLTRIQDLGGRVNLKRGGYEVDLTKTGVEDADLAGLKHLPNLKNVDLQGTNVTDAGVAQLEGINTLEYVYVQRTGVTPEAVEKLRKSLPNAEVNY
ncbi:MAG TPA: hypothetical protein VHV08_07485 [Pirellulales bacterium]|jgi:hypothetical protein|nr:hypothetical protein [Pirellulales bacterium]